jgi:hypothetical protein
MSQIWMQSLDGHAHDLVQPNYNTIDFSEIARTLANINRYNGCTKVPVSVAFHTIIATSLVQTDRMKALVLLHDCHEAFIGDITTPCAMAIAQVAAELYMGVGNGGAGDCVKRSIVALKGRHDTVIHGHAGVKMPDTAERHYIHEADIRALATERRDFLSLAPQLWAPEVEAATPSPFAWADKWLGPADMADVLLSMFKAYLPALATRSDRFPGGFVKSPNGKGFIPAISLEARGEVA